MPSYDTIVWLPNALVLTAILLVATWFVWRSRGLRAGVRMFGVSMLPLALYFIGLWRLLWSLVLQFSTFFTGFVFRPSVWLGTLMLLVALALIVLPGRLSRGLGAAPKPAAKKSIAGQSSGRQPVGDELEDIEAILKRHGIQ